MAHPPVPVQPWAPVQARRPGVQVLEVVGIALGSLGVLAMVMLIGWMAGLAGTTLAGLLALLPLAVVLWGIRWIDKWEPEPHLTLLAAFLWGGGVATVISLVFNSAFAGAAAQTSLAPNTQLALSVGVVAPVVEEVTKGLGVLAIFLFRRRFFDGPVDGIVYAATVAAGFAFVENILYFAQYGEALGSVFFGRAVMAPFAHVVFTASIGIALGLASRRGTRGAWILYFPLGLLGAVLLHALWNLSTLSAQYLLLYLTLQVPMFVALVALVRWLRSQEAAVLRNRLGAFANAGWLAPHEAVMVASLRERRRAREWAARFGRRRQMAEFQRRATAVAYASERLATGRVPVTAAEQDRMLHDLTVSRHALYAGI